MIRRLGQKLIYAWPTSQPLFLKDAQFIVNQKMRKKILLSDLHRPHAFIIGEAISNPKVDIEDEVEYDPYVCDSFTLVSNKKKVTSSPLCKIIQRKIFTG